MKINYNYLGLALGALGVLWLFAILTASPVLDKIDPIILRLFDKRNISQVPDSEVENFAKKQMWVMRITGLLYVWVLPFLPLLILRWTRLYWRAVITVLLFLLLALII